MKKKTMDRYVLVSDLVYGISKTRIIYEAFKIIRISNNMLYGKNRCEFAQIRINLCKDDLKVGSYFARYVGNDQKLKGIEGIWIKEVFNQSMRPMTIKEVEWTSTNLQRKLEGKTGI